LQQGRFVGDVLYFTGDDVPNYLGYRHELNPPLPLGYDYDVCNAEVIQKASVREGQIVLPGGMSYRVLLLPDTKRMRPELLSKIHELAQAGAVMVGPKPSQSPSLTGFPSCDPQVQKLADSLWGVGDDRTVDRMAGKAPRKQSCKKLVNIRHCHSAFSPEIDSRPGPRLRSPGGQGGYINTERGRRFSWKK
jgi:hypothetical protein